MQGKILVPQKTAPFMCASNNTEHFPKARLCFRINCGKPIALNLRNPKHETLSFIKTNISLSLKGKSKAPGTQLQHSLTLTGPITFKISHED